MTTTTSAGTRLDVLDPATGEVVESVATAPRERAEVLRRTFEVMTARREGGHDGLEAFLETTYVAVEW